MLERKAQMVAPKLLCSNDALVRRERKKTNKKETQKKCTNGNKCGQTRYAFNLHVELTQLMTTALRSDWGAAHLRMLLQALTPSRTLRDV